MLDYMPLQVNYIWENRIEQNKASSRPPHPPAMCRQETDKMEQHVACGKREHENFIVKNEVRKIVN